MDSNDEVKSVDNEECVNFNSYVHEAHHSAVKKRSTREVVCSTRRDSP